MWAHVNTLVQLWDAVGSTVRAVSMYGVRGRRVACCVQLQQEHQSKAIPWKDFSIRHCTEVSEMEAKAGTLEAGWGLDCNWDGVIMLRSRETTPHSQY